MPWSEIGRGKYSVIRGIDPAADWLLGPGIDCYLPDAPEKTLIPCIMKLLDESAIGILNKILDSNAEIYVPPSYKISLSEGRHFTVLVRKKFFDNLAKEGGYYAAFRKADKLIKLCAPQDPSALPKLEAGKSYPEVKDYGIAPPVGGWPEGTVIVGIIDDGVAFAHERFRKGMCDTRVECFWHQDGKWDNTGVATVSSGNEICKHNRATDNRAGIDKLLSDSMVSGSVDEDQLYRRAGLIDFADSRHKSAAWRAAHGTHVLDLAAGADMANSVRDRPIVAVQIQSATTADTSGAKLENKLHQGIEYILKRADDLAGDGPPLPVVINFSYGLIAGPHDGKSDIEIAFDNFIRDRQGPLQIVLPAGNSHLSRCYAEINFPVLAEEVEPEAAADDAVEAKGFFAGLYRKLVPAAGGFSAAKEEDEDEDEDEDEVEGEKTSTSLRWRVQPDDRTCSTIEVWLPQADVGAAAAERIELSVVSPSGVESPRLSETSGTGVHLLDDDGRIICTLSYALFTANQRGLYRIDLLPTVRLQPATTPALAPSGYWTVRFHNVGFGAADLVQAWVQRDDTPYGFPLRGRQSYFDEPCYERFDSQGREIEDDLIPPPPPCIVKRRSLINAIATGNEVVVAGGYRGKELLATGYSAGGPITPPENPREKRKPDALFESEGSRVHFGVLAAGSRSGSVVAFNGTSVAAPQLTRWIANQLAQNAPADRDAVKVEAQNQDPPAPPLPAERGGWGRISRVNGLPIVRLPRYW